jgi:glycosyltransferase involved in cell wall biosynthesis
MAKVLYLSYDGISDPLGQSQVLPYVLGLARLGHTIHLISFEKAARFQVLGERLHEVMREAGIAWHPQPYTKQPPVLSTVWDLHRLRQTARSLHREHHFDLVHCRSYVAALAGIELKRHGNVKFVFDMRGLWADEKVEGGAWNLRNPLFRSIYRFFKAREAEFVTEADAIVSLSHAGRREVKRWLAYHMRRPPIAVVPCAASFTDFQVSSAGTRAEARTELGIPPDAYVVVYHGSLGTWYMLQEMLDWFAILTATRARSRFLIMTPESPEIVHKAAAGRGIDLSQVVVVSAEHERVPFYLRAADVGLFFVRPTFSKRASCPTKLGELLALGIPVVTNAGIGDVDDILSRLGAGFIVQSFSPDAYRHSIAQLAGLAAVDPGELRERARQLLDLPAAVDAYDAVYRNVLRPVDAGRLPGVAG